MNDTDAIKKTIKAHRESAINLKRHIELYTPQNYNERKNQDELLAQMYDCNRIADWLEELLMWRSQQL